MRTIGRSGARSSSTWSCDKTLRGAMECRAENVAHVMSAMFGAMAPDSSLVMSRRLAMKRLSRSASSCTVAEQIALQFLVKFAE